MLISRQPTSITPDTSILSHSVTLNDILVRWWRGKLQPAEKFSSQWKIFFQKYKMWNSTCQFCV